MKTHGKLASMTLFFSVLLISSFIYLHIWGIHRFLASHQQSSVRIIEDAIRNAAVQCYALEGSYPSDLEYLKKYYGILLNEEDYFYHYEAVASNIIPDIQVIKK